MNIAFCDCLFICCRPVTKGNAVRPNALEYVYDNTHQLIVCGKNVYCSIVSNYHLSAVAIRTACRFMIHGAIRFNCSTVMQWVKWPVLDLLSIFMMSHAVVAMRLCRLDMYDCFTAKCRPIALIFNLIILRMLFCLKGHTPIDDQSISLLPLRLVIDRR